MRFAIPLALLGASLASATTFADLLTDSYGKCGAACVIPDAEKIGSCGDMTSSSSNTCYCQNFEEIMTKLVSSTSEAQALGTCFNKCNIDLSNLDFTKIESDAQSLCAGTSSSSTDSSSDSSVTTTGSGSSSTPTPSSSVGSSKTDTSSKSTPTTGAASTLSGSKVAVAAGALAFLGYAL